MIELRLLLFVAAIGWLGWPFRRLTTTDSGNLLRNCWATFLGGLGIVVFSLCGILLTGSFLSTVNWILVLVALVVWKRVFRPDSRQKSGVIAYAGFILVLSLLTVGLYRVVPPFESVVMSQDSAVYIGAAFHMSRTG